MDTKQFFFYPETISNLNYNLIIMSEVKLPDINKSNRGASRGAASNNGGLGGGEQNSMMGVQR